MTLHRTNVKLLNRILTNPESPRPAVIPKKYVFDALVDALQKEEAGHQRRLTLGQCIDFPGKGSNPKGHTGLRGVIRKKQQQYCLNARHAHCFAIGNKAFGSRISIIFRELC